MQQLKLFDQGFELIKTIDFENIKATFMKIWENIYELILEINSNKFLINFQATMNQIEQMEIVAIKWFVELSISIVKTIKKIVSMLYFEF